MKKYFLTGLAILLPFTMTIFIVAFVVDLFTEPFQSIVESSFIYYHFLDQPFLVFSGEQMLLVFSKIFILIILFLMALIIGFLGKMILTKSLIQIGEQIIHRIPIISSIYKLIKEVIRNLLSSNQNTFTQVALVSFPHSRAYSLGLLSTENQDEGTDQITVFVPTAPNPTIGYVIVVKRDHLIFIDMKVEEAMRCIVSCGIMIPDFNHI